MKKCTTDHTILKINKTEISSVSIYVCFQRHQWYVTIATACSLPIIQ